VLFSPLSSEEVRERLRGLLTPEVDGGPPECDGAVHESDFRLRRRPGWLGPTATYHWRPVLRGTFRSTENGTLIQGSFPFDIVERIGFVAFSAILIPWILSVREPGYAVAASVLFLLALVLTFSPGGLGKRQLREALEEAIAVRKPWKPYEGDRA
jgi:hypothetical protein